MLTAEQRAANEEREKELRQRIKTMQAASS